MVTYDPDVVMESQTYGYVRYARRDGARWEVHGVCDQRGDCLIGAAIDGETVRDHAHLETLKLRLGVTRLVSDLDVPLGPNYDGSCCPLRIVVLNGH